MKCKKTIKKIAPYSEGKGGLKTGIKMSSNEAPFPLDANSRKVLIETAKKINRYPEKDPKTLKKLISKKYGIIVISPAFIGKPWPEYELRGLVSREIDEDKVILPIWHGVTRKRVVEFSPPLADKLAIDTSSISSQEVAIQILKVIRFADMVVNHIQQYSHSLAVKATDGFPELNYLVQPGGILAILARR